MQSGCSSMKHALCAVSRLHCGQNATNCPDIASLRYSENLSSLFEHRTDHTPSSTAPRTMPVSLHEEPCTVIEA